MKNQLDWILDLELVDQSYLDKQIEMFAWTRELKDGRIPRPIKNYKGFGSWKAATSFPGSSLLLRKDPGWGWSRDTRKFDRPWGRRQSIKLHASTSALYTMKLI